MEEFIDSFIEDCRKRNLSDFTFSAYRTDLLDFYKYTKSNGYTDLITVAEI